MFLFLTPLASETYAREALTLATSMLRNTTRPGVAQAVVFITDGESSTDPVPVARQLKTLGTTVVVIGVGGLVNAATLQNMASTNQYYQLNNFSELSSIVGPIRFSLCGELLMFFFFWNTFLFATNHSSSCRTR